MKSLIDTFHQDATKGSPTWSKGREDGEEEEQEGEDTDTSAEQSVDEPTEETPSAVS